MSSLSTLNATSVIPRTLALIEESSAWVTLPLFYIPVMLVGMASNCVVILVFIAFARVRTISNALVVALSVADTNILVFVAMNSLVEVFLVKPSLEDSLAQSKISVWCVMSSNLTAMSTMASFTTIMIISVHRFMLIARTTELYMQAFGRRWKVVMWALAPWLLALPTCLHTRAVYMASSFTCQIQFSQQVATVALFALCYAAIAVMYSTSVRKLNGCVKKAQIYSSKKKKQKLVQRAQLLKKRLMFSSINIHLYIPYLVVLIWVELHPPDKLDQSLAIMFAMAKWVLILCSSLNSLVYGALNIDIRRYLIKLFLCAPSKGNSSVQVDASSDDLSAMCSILLSPSSRKSLRIQKRLKSMGGTGQLHRFSFRLPLEPFDSMKISGDSMIGDTLPGYGTPKAFQDEFWERTMKPIKDIPGFMSSLNDVPSNVFNIAYSKAFVESSTQLIHSSNFSLLTLGRANSFPDMDTIGGLELLKAEVCQNSYELQPSSSFSSPEPSNSVDSVVLDNSTTNLPKTRELKRTCTHTSLETDSASVTNTNSSVEDLFRKSVDFSLNTDTASISNTNSSVENLIKKSLDVSLKTDTASNTNSSVENLFKKSSNVSLKTDTASNTNSSVENLLRKSTDSLPKTKTASVTKTTSTEENLSRKSAESVRSCDSGTEAKDLGSKPTDMVLDLALTKSPQQNLHRSP